MISSLRTWTVAAALMIAVALTPPRVAIAVSPHSVIAGGSIRVTCSVARADGNRWLVIALEGFSLSQRQLDGADAPITHRLTFDRVPCGVETAICLVATADGTQYRDAAQVLVAGCAE